MLGSESHFPGVAWDSSVEGIHRRLVGSNSATLAGSIGPEDDSNGSWGRGKREGEGDVR